MLKSHKLVSFRKCRHDKSENVIKNVEIKSIQKKGYTESLSSGDSTFQ